MTLPVYRVDVLDEPPAVFFVRARDAEDAKRFVRSLDGQTDRVLGSAGATCGELRARRVDITRR